MAHEYHGTVNSRAMRKQRKLTAGQPEPIALDRIVVLLTDRIPPPRAVVSGVFNLPRVTRRTKEAG